MKKISKFLGIQYDEILETPTRLGKKWEGNASDGQKREKVQARPNDFYQHLSDQATSMIDIMLHKKMDKYRYELNAQYGIVQKLYYNYLFIQKSRFAR